MEVLKNGSKNENVKALQQLLGLDADGIFGNDTEKAVKEFQEKNDLTADGIVGDKTWEKLLSKKGKLSSKGAIGCGVVYRPIDKHITKKPNRKIEYLVIHFTAGSKSCDGAAEKNRNVFLNREASADFVVDDDVMLQVNPDPQIYYCWAVGDGKGKRGITNANCVSIEICSSLKKGTTAKVPNHEGWYFTEKSLENAVILAKLMMEAYNIPLEKVVRHYDASGKLCPGILGWNTGIVYDAISGKKTNKKSDEKEWLTFKERLAN